MINKLTTKISRGGQLSIYIFRLTPFTRGYTSVITGLLRVKPKVFLPIAIITAVTWASFYILIGHLIGPSWNIFTQNIGSFKYIMFAVLAIILFLFLLTYYNRKGEKLKENTGISNS